MNWPEILSRVEILNYAVTLIIFWLVICIYRDVRDLKKFLKGAKEVRKERKKHLTEKDNEKKL